MDPETYKYPKIRLGLCCSNLTLKYHNDVYSSRRKNLDSIIKNGLIASEEVAKTNLIDLTKMMLWGKNHGIDVMRISSELVPHGNNIKLVETFGQKGEEFLTLKFIEPYLRIAGEVAKLEEIRLTFHPGQYVQLATNEQLVFDNSIRELNMHATFLDMMQTSLNSVIVIHIGGMYNDKKTTISRFIKNFNNLDYKISSRVVLENDEKCYDAHEVLEICQAVKRPMVFDYHHYVCYKKYHPDETQVPINKLMPEILKTWTNLDLRPKFHLSEQMPNKPVGSHSLFVNKIPNELLEIPSKYKIDIDIMIEAKGKEVAIAKLYKLYPVLKPPLTKKLPLKIPEAALKDLNVPEEIKDEMKCECEKDGGYTNRFFKYRAKYAELKYG